MSPAELEQALRASHPQAVVHRRELDAERTPVWYVYRDGHWISPPAGEDGGAEVSDKSDDLRATAEDLIADAEELKRIEERKLEIDEDDREADRLADESEDLVRSMLPKTRVEKQISDAPDED